MGWREFLRKSAHVTTTQQQTLTPMAFIQLFDNVGRILNVRLEVQEGVGYGVLTGYLDKL